MATSKASRRSIAGRYELQDTLGEGGMGVIWLAEDQLLRRPVAVKELRIPAGVFEEDRPVLRERLLREAQAASRLNHPGATTVYDVVEDDGQAYIVMELVRAPTLYQLVSERGPCDPALTARIGLLLLDALEAAHAAGIVHRDVKPSNVLITPDGTVKLTDFGIASVQGDPALTAAGVVLGSPSYISPEQARGDRVTPAADVWSLGATLYFTVEGVTPFDRGHPIATVTAVLRDDPRPPQRAGPLAPALGAALVKDPARRVDMGELRALLQQIADPVPYGPVETGPLPPDADPVSSDLRTAAGRAARDLAPAVSALLAQHEARYPPLRRLRAALGGTRDTAGGREPPPQPQSSPLEPLRQRLRHAWIATKLLAAVLLVGLLVAGYFAYQAFFR